MANFMDIITTRRSVRKFKPDKIQKSIIEKIIRAGMYAPSAYNEKPWEFMVITEHDTLVKIPIIHEYAEMTKEAPVAILVCANLEREKLKNFWIEDCSAAVQNMLLAIHSFDLGGVWVGIYPDEKKVESFKRFFGLPANIIPFALIPLGIPREKPYSSERFDSSRIRYERWN